MNTLAGRGVATVGLMLAGFAGNANAGSARMYSLEAPAHRYGEIQPTDRFSRWLDRVRAEGSEVPVAGERAFLDQLLGALEVPVASQLLVYSATSFQRLINPSNPRALYFNDDTYVGYVPGGRIEVASFDPQAGLVFQIFDRVSGGRMPAVERSERCLNCHAAFATRGLPGLVLESVAVNFQGGTLESYRTGPVGHQVPLDHRFGGWHLTGRHSLPEHHGNMVGRMESGKVVRIDNPPGQRAPSDRYPRPGSDIGVHLVHEHQLGFTNLAIEAIWLARELSHRPGQPADAAELDELARRFAGYILFADEARLPLGTWAVDPDFETVFRGRGRRLSDGRSLREFDLRNRLFRHRCSYMIETPVWDAVPTEIKDRIFRHLWIAVAPTPSQAPLVVLSPPEKESIRRLVAAATRVPDYWR